MKTLIRSFSIVLLALAVVSTGQVMGQGRGHAYGKYNNPGHNRKGDHYTRPDEHWYADRRYDYGTYYSRRHTDHRYDRYRYTTRWAPVDHHRVPRYVYFREYNVYYDCHRHTYLSYVNGGWIVSAQLPTVMARANVASTVAVGVDYYEDDFHHYLARRRPAYFSVRVTW